jgi:hypothetical protein
MVRHETGSSTVYGFGISVTVSFLDVLLRDVHSLL